MENTKGLGLSDGLERGGFVSRMTLPQLKAAALVFAQDFSTTTIAALYGITDGKAVGTHVEHAFHQFLKGRYSYVPAAPRAALTSQNLG